MCDAACVKIIINGGFMAVLATEAAQQWDGEAGSAADRLALAANLQVEMFKARGLTAQASDSFDGCAQAVLLVHWINNGPVPDAAERMDAWTADIWKSIQDLAEGKFPG